MKRFLTTAIVILAILINGTIAKAQNTGPVAPEAMSFEPVDATDMVSLNTGDISYVIPLFTVPSPEGGYPIALSYHAGITMDQEASWTGLGWTINPGALNRSVFGFPDDVRDGVQQQVLYNDGGTITNNFIGIRIPLTYVSIGLKYSWGSYESITGSIGITGGPEFNGTFGDGGWSVGIEYAFAYASVGSNGYNLGVGMKLGEEASVGIGLGSGGANVNISAGGFSFMASSSGDIGVGFSSAFSSIGINFNSKGEANSYFSAMGMSLMPPMLATRNNISTLTTGWAVELYYISFGHQKTRWWYYKEEEKNTFGSLYGKEAYKLRPQGYGGQQDRNTFMDTYSDTYDYIDEILDDKNTVDISETKAIPSFMAYDNYSVSAQGLGGTISPKYFESGLILGNSRVITDGYEISSDQPYYDSFKSELDYHFQTSTLHQLSKSGNQLYFYFDNMISPNLSVNTVNFAYNGGNSDPVWGDYSFTGGEVNPNVTRNGSGRHIEWFSNYDIVHSNTPASRGFIETNSIAPDPDYPTTPRDNKTFFEPDGIGAFTITSEDGTSYHYSLPVYQYESFIRKQFNNTDFTEQRNLSKYAYTWLLTAITGPDYVDRGNPGPDESDWGYWVEFEYGKWTDGYIWQNPYTRENSLTPYSWGRKQIYYLNSIKTRTHTALFIKGLREDGEGKDMYLNDRKWYTQFVGKTTTILDQHRKCSDGTTYTLPDPNGYGTSGYYTYSLSNRMTIKNHDFRHKVLKLEKIILLTNDKLNSLTTKNNSTNFLSKRSSSINFEEQKSYVLTQYKVNPFCNKKSCGKCSTDYNSRGCDDNCNPCDLFNITYEEQPLFCETKSIIFESYLQDNILDINDIQGKNLESVALKVIKFNFDYALCPSTPNSSASNGGKLTLNSVETLGKGGTKITPPYAFEYYNNGNFNLERKDNWGFDKDYPQNWSLASIKSPTGAQISIDYEGDIYGEEAIYDGHFIDHVSFTYLPLARMEVTLPYNNNDILDLCSKTNDYWIYIWHSCYGPPSPMCYQSQKVSFNRSTCKIVFNNIPCAAQKIIIVARNEEGMKGGGVRTKTISIDDNNGNIYKTEYNYNNPSSSFTSGKTTYAPPYGENQFIPYINEIPSPQVFYEYVTVTSKSTKNKTNGYTEYRFKVPNTTSGLPSLSFASEPFSIGDLLSVTKVQNSQLNTVPSTKATSYKIDNKTSLMGQLMEVKYKNAENHLLKTVKYNYSQNPSLGVVQETFYYLKNYKQWDKGHRTSTSNVNFGATSICNYPSILESIVTTTPSGTASEFYEDYDQLSGKPLTTRSISVNGDEVRSKIVPAYHIYKGEESIPYTPGMNSKNDDIRNKNMLTQPAATYTEKLIAGKWETFGAEVQTWNNKWDYLEFDDDFSIKSLRSVNSQEVWRKHQTFVWKGKVNDDGSFKDFTTFNFDINPTDNSSYGWQRTNTITRYNHFSSPIESMDINGKYTSSQLGNRTSKPIAVAANSSLFEATHCSFEEAPLEGTSNYGFDGGFIATKGTGAPQRCLSGTESVASHSGSYHLKINNNPLVLKLLDKMFTLKPKKYIISVWATDATYSNISLGIQQFSGANGTSVISNVTKAATDFKTHLMGNWRLLTYEFEILSNARALSIAIGGANVIVDDVRLQPKEGGLNAYTYDDAGNVTAILDNNNFATKYEYDAGGRLIATYKETPQGFKKTSSQQYNYQRSLYPIDYTYYGLHSDFNVAQALSFAASDASSGATYTWDFGDGTTGTGQSVSHTYPVNNPDAPRSLFNPTVTLTVTETDGKITKKSKTFNFPYLRITSPGTTYAAQPNSSFDITWDSNAMDGFFDIHSSSGYINNGIMIDYKTRSYRITINENCPRYQSIPITISYYQNNKFKTEVTLNVNIY